MRLVYGRTDEVARFVGARIEGGERGFGECTAIGIEDAGKIVAGMVFHNWSPEAEIIEITSASDSAKWLTSAVRYKLFSYPFDEIGCQMVVLSVAEDNRRMVRIAKAYGFTGHLIPNLRGRGRAGYIFTLTDDAWRSGRFYSKELTHVEA